MNLPHEVFCISKFASKKIISRQFNCYDCTVPAMIKEFIHVHISLLLFTVVFDGDSCDPDPCVNGACVDLVLDYRCDCDPGITGKNCSCKLSVHNSCNSSRNRKWLCI